MLSKAIIWDLLLWWYPFRRQKHVKEGNINHDDDDGWILIENGSYNGYFDWIPIHLRIGKWSICAILYFRLLWICALFMLWYDIVCTSTGSESDTTVCMIDNTTMIPSSSSSSMVEQQCTTVHTSSSSSSDEYSFTSYLHYIVRRYWIKNSNIILQQMSPIIIGSTVWYYHTMIGLYMTYICYNIIRYTSLSYKVWITYTIQSWTLLMIRHWLYAISPFLDNHVSPATSTTATSNSAQQDVYNNDSSSNNLIIIAELIRFPCAVAHTITFMIWNFILVPYILYVALQNEPKKRSNFIQFNTSYKLINLHIINIIFCICNVWIFNPTATTTPSQQQFT